MRELVARPAKDAPYVEWFGKSHVDSALLRYTTSSGADLVYTVVYNQAHQSIELIFPEHWEYAPDEDTLHVVSGFLTSRPNLLLHVSESQLGDFVVAWKALRFGDASGAAFVAKYAARRSDPNFWATYDFFGDAYRKSDAVQAAAIDLSRYVSL